MLSTPGYSAYLKIAEGCDHPCSFCVIPQMRGAFRSRRFASVIREAENLAKQGVREITIVGQDTTSYGEDLGLRDGLPALLRELGKIPDLVWVRFLYCYPNRVTEALIAAVAETPKVAKYFDIPLQHASSSVLKLMKRGSNGQQFLRLLEKIRAAIPGVALRTSFIVGFPGETDDDFKALLDFVAAAEFDHLGVFLYSNEETSRSFALPNQVPAPTRSPPAEAAHGPPAKDFAAQLAADGGKIAAGAGGRPLGRNRIALSGPQRAAGARHRRLHPHQ